MEDTFVQLDANIEIVHLFCKSLVKYRLQPGYSFINGQHLNALKTKT